MSQVRENIEDSEYKIAGWIGKTLGVVLQVSDRYELILQE